MIECICLNIIKCLDSGFYSKNFLNINNLSWILSESYSNLGKRIELVDKKRMQFY